MSVKETDFRIKDGDLTLITQEGWTALMLASYRGHVAVVELLLEHNSDVILTNKVYLIVTCVHKLILSLQHTTRYAHVFMSHDCYRLNETHNT